MKRLLVHRAILDGVHRPAVRPRKPFQPPLEHRHDGGLAAAHRSHEQQNPFADVQPLGGGVEIFFHQLLQRPIQTEQFVLEKIVCLDAVFLFDAGRPNHLVDSGMRGLGNVRFLPHQFDIVAKRARPGKPFFFRPVFRNPLEQIQRSTHPLSRTRDERCINTYAGGVDMFPSLFGGAVWYNGTKFGEKGVAPHGVPAGNGTVRTGQADAGGTGIQGQGGSERLRPRRLAGRRSGAGHRRAEDRLQPGARLPADGPRRHDAARLRGGGIRSGPAPRRRHVERRDPVVPETGRRAHRRAVLQKEKTGSLRAVPAGRNGAGNAGPPEGGAA